MGHIPRRAQKRDANEKEMVAELRSRGISVMYGSEVDLIVGYRARTYLFEVKQHDKLFLKDGVTFRAGAIKPSQSKLMSTWRGHWCVVWSIEQILNQIGYRV
jgi:hypothetical protein